MLQVSSLYGVFPNHTIGGDKNSQGKCKECGRKVAIRLLKNGLCPQCRNGEERKTGFDVDLEHHGAINYIA